MDLNDDCLLHIFKLLNLKDQISVAISCRRFHFLISYLWQSTYRSLSLNFGIDDITINEFSTWPNEICGPYMEELRSRNDLTLERFKALTVKEFSVLMKAICDTVEKMRLKDLSIEKFTVLKLYKYPKLEKFSFTRWSHCTLNDDTILEMTRIFPKLRLFSPHGCFSGRYMENWKFLEFLNLTYCSNVKFCHLENIFEKLLLKQLHLNIFDKQYEWTSKAAFKNFCNLETIFLNTVELAWLSNLCEFINLKELTIADRDVMFHLPTFLKNLDKRKRNELLELETSLYFQLSETECEEFKSIRKLIIVSQNICTYIKICSSVSNLREIIFKTCDIPTTYQLSLLTKLPQIEFISVEQCKCGFRDFEINGKEIEKNRTKLLRFNFYENSCYLPHSQTYTMFAVVKLITQQNSPLLKITENLQTSVSFQPLWVCFQ